MGKRQWLIIGALSGLVWVSLGAAMGHDVLHGKALVYFEKAQRYHIVHTILLLWLASYALVPRWQVVASLWALGVILFSGCLYTMAIFSLPLRYVVPVGGVIILLGWAILVVSLWRSR